MISMFVCILHLHLFETTLGKVFLISAVLTKPPVVNCVLYFFLLSWRLKSTHCSFFYRETCVGVFFVEWCIFLLYFSITDGISHIQSTFPFSNSGFLIFYFCSIKSFCITTFEVYRETVLNLIYFNSSSTILLRYSP